MKPVVIVKGRKAELNPDKNKLTIDFLFPNPYGKKGTKIKWGWPQKTWSPPFVVRTPKSMAFLSCPDYQVHLLM